VVFHICGDLIVPTELTEVRVSLLDGELSELSYGVRELVSVPMGVMAPDASPDGGEADASPPDGDAGAVSTAEATQLPVTTVLPARERVEWARGEALLGGSIAARFDRHVTSLRDGGVVDIWFDQGCYGITCPRGQTCIDAACVLAPGADDPPGCGGGGS
jgi:hypothetical protein